MKIVSYIFVFVLCSITVISCNRTMKENDIKIFEKAFEEYEKEQRRKELINEVMTATDESVKANLEYLIKKRLEIQNSEMESKIQEIEKLLSDMHYSYKIAPITPDVGASDGSASKLLQITPSPNNDEDREEEFTEEKKILFCLMNR